MSDDGAVTSEWRKAIRQRHNAEAGVLSIHPTKPVTQLKITVKHQDGETVLNGEAWCYTFR
ncbi:hypothetical protein L0337_09675 [candidate division KSB1 bacterium]|nr:hypothetical protein [candidate division KSB1 bacterium]